jgi:beta-glucanase (GH16 family)
MKKIVPLLDEIAKPVMCLFFLLIAFAEASFAQPESPPVCPAGEDWVFLSEFSDEFNDKNLESEKWWDFNPTWHGRKPAYFARENVEVKDGYLQLTARVQKPDEVTVENKVRGHDKFTTACVKSKKRIKYGYFEARCQSMNANVCNAFWLYDPLDPPAKYKEGNFSEEIDIFEIVGKPSPELWEEKNRMCYTTVHRFGTPYLDGVVNHNRFQLSAQGSKCQVPFDFHAGFHIYGFLWTPEEMKWYVDGKEVFSRDNDFFHTALYVVFDCETLWGVPDPADLPSTFSIDYVRIWQSEN